MKVLNERSTLDNCTCVSVMTQWMVELLITERDMNSLLPSMKINEILGISKN